MHQSLDRTVCLLLAAVFSAVSTGGASVAGPEYTYSVEWSTHTSDLIVVAEVTAVETLKETAERPYPMRYVHCALRETLRGVPTDPLSFDESNFFENVRGDREEPRPLQAGDYVLLFRVEREPEMDRWLDLSHPSKDQISGRAAFNNDVERVGDEAQILELVKRRITLETAANNHKSRGLIVYLPSTGITLVRTADPEYKATLINQLKRSPVDYSTLEAIYNLVSYPDRETVRLLQPFLNDRTVTGYRVATQNPSPWVRKLRAWLNLPPSGTPIYAVSDAAYLALWLLGEKPVKPLTYSSGPYTRTSPFGEEFESSFANAKIPTSGRWKRWSKDALGNEVLP